MRRLRWLLLQLKGLWVFRRRVVVFGNFTVVHPQQVSIGSNCAVNHGVFILARARVEIADDVVLSARCMLIDGGLQARGFAVTEHSYVDRPIRIDQGAWIGAGAIILPGVTIGTKSIVGAGSVVTKDVPDFSIVAGNPARVIGRTDAPG
jgi:maltose O-acetyltransferase